MASHDPQAYGWLAAALLAAINALYLLIRKVVPWNSKDPLAKAVQEDFAKLSKCSAVLAEKITSLTHALEELKEEVKADREKLEQCRIEIRSLYARLGTNGDQKRR